MDSLTDLVERLPKSDLHVHLDGSLRIETLIELARERRVRLPSETAEGLYETVFKPTYGSLAEYLEGFRYTTAVLQDREALERAAYELCVDSFAEGTCYIEVRFAPQLHVRRGFPIGEVVAAVARGIRRAEEEAREDERVLCGELPPFRAAILLCALRKFTPEMSEGYRAYFESCGYSPEEEIFARASLDLARAAVALSHEEGLPVTGVDLAGQEKGYPAETHRQAFQVAHEGFLGKTVHAGEDFGPESIFQAIGDLHADRIGHGTWLLDPSRVTDPGIDDPERFVERLAEYVADRRVTLEVCLTSNQQTTPELSRDLAKHPFGEMVRRRFSVALCTDNRLVSRTTVSREWRRAIETFGLDRKRVKDIVAYGFKRSFFPGPYLEKRAYVRRVLDCLDRVLFPDER